MIGHIGAQGTAVLGSLRRRRLQALIIGVVFALATLSATIALNVLVEAQAPYDRAFAAANGAHLVIDYDGNMSPSQVAATAQAGSVTDAAGPWPVGIAGFLLDPAQTKDGATPFYQPAPVSARGDPGTSVDRVTITAGRWWSAPGELVLAQSRAEQLGISVGDTVTLEEVRVGEIKGVPGGNGNGNVKVGPGTAAPEPNAVPPATRTFTVVGIAGSVSTPGVWAWVSPEDLTALMPGKPLLEMLYRVDPSSTEADLAAAASAITQSIPPDSVSGVDTYLAAKADVDRTAAIFAPILLAFAIFALLAAAFVIVDVVTGIVLGSYRDIGVMKAIGYTPRQVVAILMAEILGPAGIGSMIGVALGTLGSQPILAETARSFQLPAAFTLSGPVITIVLIAALGTAALASAVPASRAGVLSPVRALARGTMPNAGGRPGALQRWLHARSWRPALRIGVAAGLAHRGRALMTLGALIVGVSAVVFTVGLNLSLERVAPALTRDLASSVRLELAGQAASPADVTAGIASSSSTGRFVEIGDLAVTVPQVGQVPFVAYRGDASWIGYVLINGRWFSGPGEAVAPTNFFTVSGLHIGDTVTIAANGRSTSVTLVGEIFDQPGEQQDDLVLRGTWADAATLAPSLAPDRWEVAPVPGMSARDYRSAIHGVLGDQVQIDVVDESTVQASLLLFESVIAALGLVLTLIALGGVFNSVLLDTRRRAREIAVLKAIGMAPRTVIGSVLASVAPIGVVAGLIGVPVGLVAQRVVLGFMGQAATKTAVPAQLIDVFTPWTLLALGAAGLVIAAIGAFVPARRAAASLVTPVLAAE